MNPNLQDYLVKAEQRQWQPLTERGINYEGVFVQSLHYDKTKARSTTILLKFEAGAAYPYHNHPGGEEVYVLSGEAQFDHIRVSAGDYLYTPPDCKHSVKTETGCTLLFVVPEEVEII